MIRPVRTQSLATETNPFLLNCTIIICSIQLSIGIICGHVNENLNILWNRVEIGNL